MNDHRQIIDKMLSQLPPQQLVSIKENITVKGKLDYSREDIWMNLDSLQQVYRLGACKKEPETVEWIETHVKPGEVFYDIGANVGAYSFIAQSVAGGNCTVYAFEPSFSTFAELNLNILLNNFSEKIIPLYVALSNETGLLKFNYSSTTPGTALHSIGEAIGEDGKQFQPAFVQPILSYRLDELIKQFALRLPNHIKLDVDGAEFSVLQGADETLLNAGIRSILVEINEKIFTYEEIPRYLESKGFRIKSKHPRLGPDLFNYIFERI
jgi:FkbM family methyltransferase